MSDTTPLTLGVLQQQVFEVNDANGWFDSDRTFLEGVCLIHTEVSEMAEAYRDHGLEDATGQGCPSQDFEGHICKPMGVGSEAADVLIRLLDECTRQDIDLEAEVVRKLAFNRTRGYKHGGKRI